MSTLPKLLFSEEVRDALEHRKPIVALESTIISHGMPFPENLQVALDVEKSIRSLGAIPATIAIMNGNICVGLESADLERFASLTNVMKCSRRDLALVISQQRDGATTVAATMIIAQLAGIHVFATGGIGGVHRGAENTFDVSADLTELARTNVAVISAGAKAILDLPKTLEYLETFGVPVIGFDTEEFPAFYSRKSGLKVPIRFNSEMEVAQFLAAKWNNQIQGGAVIANPIPENFELDFSEMESNIQMALEEANTAGIVGKSLTPFLLKKLNEITQGKSQVANRALVIHNAELGARIAKSLTELGF